MDVNNCVEICCLAETLSLKALEKQSMDFIFEHFSIIYRQVSGSPVTVSHNNSNAYAIVLLNLSPPQHLSVRPILR